MRLQARLALSMAAAASVSIFLVATAFWLLSARDQRTSVDDFLVERVEEIQALGDPQPGRRGRVEPGQVARAFDRSDLLRFRFETGDGETRVDDGLPAAEATGDRITLTSIRIDGDRYRMAVGRVGPAGRVGTVQVARNVEEVERSLARLRGQLVLGSLLGIGLAGLLGAVTAKRLSTPISQVATAARQMATRQDLPSRIVVDRNDEVGDLAESFNHMLTALAVSRDQQQRLVADASHELRTPLTSLRLKIDLLDSTPELPGPQRQELLAGAAVELERLTDLVSELVDLAADPSGVDEPESLTDLGGLVSDVAERARRSSGRDISVSATPLSAVVRPGTVKRALSNLIDNAIKYSPPDRPVEVRMDDGRFEVRDHGEGIPADDLEHVFDRFYRSPAARTRPGNGIGLAIVERVAELHGGQVWARNAVDGGAIVGFSVGIDRAPSVVD